MYQHNIKHSYAWRPSPLYSVCLRKNGLSVLKIWADGSERTTRAVMVDETKWTPHPSQLLQTVDPSTTSATFFINPKTKKLPYIQQLTLWEVNDISNNNHKSPFDSLAERPITWRDTLSHDQKAHYNRAKSSHMFTYITVMRRMPHDDILVKDGPHIRWWSRKIITP